MFITSLLSCFVPCIRQLFIRFCILYKGASRFILHWDCHAFFSLNSHFPYRAWYFPLAKPLSYLLFKNFLIIIIIRWRFAFHTALILSSSQLTVMLCPLVFKSHLVSNLLGKNDISFRWSRFALHFRFLQIFFIKFIHGHMSDFYKRYRIVSLSLPRFDSTFLDSNVLGCASSCLAQPRSCSGHLLSPLRLLVILTVSFSLLFEHDLLINISS